MEQVCATEGAFAAILEGGDVVAWGHPDFGGDSRAVRGQLRGAKDICSTERAFAVLLTSGGVVSWGPPLSENAPILKRGSSTQTVREAVDYGGDCSLVQEQLSGVVKIYSTASAFAALLDTGRVVTWGDQDHGGDSRCIIEQLVNVSCIHSNRGAFAAVLAGGGVVTWGSQKFRGDSGNVQKQLSGSADVVQICTTMNAFAVVLRGVGVVTWGDAKCGGDSSQVQEQLHSSRSGDLQLFSTGYAFAAILADGRTVTWGHPEFGGDSSDVKQRLHGVQHIYAAGCKAMGGAFAAILADGSVVTWGASACGGHVSPKQAPQMKNRAVKEIYSNGAAFAAILEKQLAPGHSASRLNAESSRSNKNRLT